MRTLIANKIFGQEFGQTYLPKIYIKMLKEEINKKKYIPTLVKVKEKRNITKNEILNCVKIENLVVSQVEDNYVIRFNDIMIKAGVPFEQVVDYINDGDLSFRGCNLFNNVTNYINRNVRTINRYYLMGGQVDGR